MEKVNIQDERLVFDDFFKIKKATLQFSLPNGKMSPSIKRLNFERKDAVAAVVFVEDEDAFLFTRQFRYPTYAKAGGWLIELAAGIIEENEEPKATMEREILEELGYKVTETKYLTTFFVSPGGSSERNHLYLCHTSSKLKVNSGGGAEGENEGIEIIKYTRQQVMDKLQNNEFQDAKTLIGLLMTLK